MTSPRQPEQSAEGGQNNLPEALTFLQRLAVFRDTPLDVLKLYAYLSKIEQYGEYEPILRQEKPADRMFLIMAGKVAICKEHKGRKFFLQHLTADGLNYFGELALLAHFNWFFSAQALTDVTLLSISREAFRKVQERFPKQYTKAVEKIVKLRINRFDDQTSYLLEHLREEAWRDCPLYQVEQKETPSDEA